MKPKILSRKIEYDKDWIKVVSAKVKFENGKTVDWNYISSGDAVAVVPADKDGNVYLSKEWRVAFDKEIIQIPAGSVKSDATEEERIQQVHNELREEIGMDAKKIEKLTFVFGSARNRTSFHIYLATNLFESKKNPDEHEYINVIKMPLDKAVDFFVKNGETPNYTIIGLLLAKEKLKNRK